MDASPREHIIGGFPYVGRVVVTSHDGAPVPDTQLEVCARLFTDVNEVKFSLFDKISTNTQKFVDSQLHQCEQPPVLLLQRGSVS